jgi:hypothetical protein
MIFGKIELEHNKTKKQQTNKNKRKMNNSFIRADWECDAKPQGSASDIRRFANKDILV